MSKTYPMIENKAQMIGHMADGCKPKPACVLALSMRKLAIVWPV